jgi:hypothetical protein
MMTFPHTSPSHPVSDRAPSLFPAVVLVLCAIVLLPFTLLAFLWWGLSRLWGN